MKELYLKDMSLTREVRRALEDLGFPRRTPWAKVHENSADAIILVHTASGDIFGIALQDNLRAEQRARQRYSMWARGTKIEWYVSADKVLWEAKNTETPSIKARVKITKFSGQLCVYAGAWTRAERSTPVAQEAIAFAASQAALLERRGYQPLAKLTPARFASFVAAARANGWWDRVIPEYRQLVEIHVISGVPLRTAARHHLRKKIENKNEPTEREVHNLTRHLRRLRNHLLRPIEGITDPSWLVRPLPFRPMPAKTADSDEGSRK